MDVSPSRSLGSFEPFAWRMNVRRMPSAPPNSPASKTTLSRGDAWPDWDASVVVQSSWANTNAAKSTSCESSTSRSRVDRPGLNVVVHGSTSATSSSPRVIAWSSLACLPDDPRKMRGLFIRGSTFGQESRTSVLDSWARGGSGSWYSLWPCGCEFGEPACILITRERFDRIREYKRRRHDRQTC